jgi:hypothetical protein
MVKVHQQQQQQEARSKKQEARRRLQKNSDLLGGSGDAVLQSRVLGPTVEINDHRKNTKFPLDFRIITPGRYRKARRRAHVK